MPSVQRANGALILAAIKSTRLVANANRPEGIFAFPVSPYYHTTENHISPPRCYTNPVSPGLCHAHHVEPTCRMAVLQPPGFSSVSLLVLGNQLRFKKKKKEETVLLCVHGWQRPPESERVTNYFSIPNNSNGIVLSSMSSVF